MWVAFGIALVSLCARLIRDNIQARYYRRATAGSTAFGPTGPSYTLTYKEGHTIKTITVPGITEPDAINSATRLYHIRYDKIISLIKN